MKNTGKNILHIVGGGLAGCEAAWQAAGRGMHVIVSEMRPLHTTDAHQTDLLAELVCSNSFRSDDHQTNAVGLLHEEMRRMDSLIMQAADTNTVPAGSALAVDRELFSRAVTQALTGHPDIDVRRERLDTVPSGRNFRTVIATGPLTHGLLADSILALTGERSLAFFDAIAPIVYTSSVDFDIAWYQSRYDRKGPDGDGADYINCPLDRDLYACFVNALLEGEKTTFREWEKSTPYFESCLPVEVMASRGPETLRFGPMKPVGLVNPATGKPAHAVVQLRQDNVQGTLYNMVGFQTKLKYAEQKRIFRMIPGLEQAEFARLGGIHRNTFINAPALLDSQLRLHAEPSVRFAGQITGVEGYLESAATGLLAGCFAAGEAAGKPLPPPPPTTALGALLGYITGNHVGTTEGKQRTFQPMNINFGLFPDIEIPPRDKGTPRPGRKEKRDARKRALTRRALDDIGKWKEQYI